MFACVFDVEGYRYYLTNAIVTAQQSSSLGSQNATRGDVSTATVVPTTTQRYLSNGDVVTS